MLILPLDEIILVNSCTNTECDCVFVSLDRLLQAQQVKKELEEKLLTVKKQPDETDSNSLMKVRYKYKCHNLFSLYFGSKRFTMMVNYTL